MTGWRVGYATGPKEVIGAMTRHQNQSTSNVNTPSQYAAIAALKGGSDFSQSLATRYEKRIDLVVDRLKTSSAFSVPAKPNGAYYLFIRADGLMARHKLSSAAEVATYLLEKAGVCVVPGDAFGDDKAFRISVTTDEKDLMFAIDRMIEVGK
jgi:aspartate aminotransferase